MELTCAFKTCSGLITYIPYPFDDGVLLCMSSVMAWWLRYHLVHAEQLRSHGDLMAQG